MSITDYNPTFMPKNSIKELLDSVSLPPPVDIQKLATQGSYHLVYVLKYPEAVLRSILSSIKTSRNSYHPEKLLLRISGTQYPARKTENESAILVYLAKHASAIPVPTIVHYDSSTDNPIGCEYQIMTLCRGVEVDSLFRSWDEETKDEFLDQIIELLQKMHAIPVGDIGGFAIEEPGNAVSAPLCEEFNWQIPGIDKYWNALGLAESPESLNARGPFKNFTELQIAWLEKYVYAIKRHPSMRDLNKLVPRLKNLISVLQNGGPTEWNLNEMRIVLAHRDLHFGNILYDAEQKRISAIIDWEFSGSTPFCKWDPPKAFLASLPYDAEGIQRKRGWVRDFQTRCDRRGIDWRELVFDSETGWSTKQQQLVHEAVDYMRCIFEVAPTNERTETVRSWAGIVEEKLNALGVT